MDTQLHYERLDCYQAAIEFLALSEKIIEVIPRGFGELKSQYRAASLSIPLNVAEGAGKKANQDRIRFFDIARGSAQECGAILDVCRVLGIGKLNDLDQGKALLCRIISMLVKMK
jgi:four helix bundle protein